jgi:hypothetical protein
MIYIPMFNSNLVQNNFIYETYGLVITPKGGSLSAGAQTLVPHWPPTKAAPWRFLFLKKTLFTKLEEVNVYDDVNIADFYGKSFR